MKTKIVRRNLTLPETIANRLKTASEETGFSQSNIVHRAVLRYLNGACLAMPSTKEKVTMNIGPYNEGMNLIHWIRVNSFKQEDPFDFIYQSSIHAFKEKKYRIDFLHDHIRDTAYMVREGKSIPEAFDELEAHWRDWCNEAEPEDFEIRPPQPGPEIDEDYYNNADDEYFASLLA